MMINDTPNPPCDFAEQLISFLYEEISASEKSQFQSHLRTCSSCTDEVAGFSVVRSTVQEWRISDFETLSTPTFEVPVKKNAIVESAGWFESIRTYLTFYPALTAAGIVVLLTMAVAIAWITSNSPKKPEFASNKGEEIRVISSPIELNSTQNSTVAVDTEKENKNEIAKVPVKNEPPKAISAPTQVVERVNVTKTQVIKPKKQLSVVAEKIHDKKPSKAFNKRSNPSLNDEEAEEESLRLSDILDEIGMR